VRLAYFEAWNTSKRNCSTLDADYIPDHFTPIHYAFVDLSSDGMPNPSGTRTNLINSRTEGTGSVFPRSVVGLFDRWWAYSSELGTYRIMRDGVLQPNREQFATNNMNWVVSNGFYCIGFD